MGSVRNQALAEHELLVVENRSTDRSREIAADRSSPGCHDYHRRVYPLIVSAPPAKASFAHRTAGDEGTPALRTGLPMFEAP
jgi:hypothetical protein